MEWGDQSEDIQWNQCKHLDRDGAESIFFILFVFARCLQIEEEPGNKQNVARRHEQNANDRVLRSPVSQTQNAGVDCLHCNVRGHLAATQ